MKIINEESLKDVTNSPEIAENAHMFGFLYDKDFSHINVPLINYRCIPDYGFTLLYRVAGVIYYLSPEVTIKKRNADTEYYFSSVWNLYRVVVKPNTRLLFGQMVGDTGEAVVLYTGPMKTLEDLRTATGPKFQQDLKEITEIYFEKKNAEIVEETSKVKKLLDKLEII